jgi:hypothetical protein
MKIRFTLKDISGSALFARFAAAIKEEGVGFEDIFGSSAMLSQDGHAWRTAMSGFTYTVMNPNADEPAVVEYDGACRGFLMQDLLPKELQGETLSAAVFEGSALERHKIAELENKNACVLVEAYGLMQKSAVRTDGEDYRMALVAVRAADHIRSHMNSLAPLQNSFVRVGPNSRDVAGSNIEAGDPSIYVTCCPGGEQVTLEIMVEPFGFYAEADILAERGIGWINRLRPVLGIAA